MELMFAGLTVGLEGFMLQGSVLDLAGLLCKGARAGAVGGHLSWGARKAVEAGQNFPRKSEVPKQVCHSFVYRDQVCLHLKASLL